MRLGEQEEMSGPDMRPWGMPNPPDPCRYDTYLVQLTGGGFRFSEHKKDFI